MHFDCLSWQGGVQSFDGIFWLLGRWIRTTGLVLDGASRVEMDFVDMFPALSDMIWQENAYILAMHTVHSPHQCDNGLSFYRP